jgi:hypothetical protein
VKINHSRQGALEPFKWRPVNYGDFHAAAEKRLQGLSCLEPRLKPLRSNKD